MSTVAPYGEWESPVTTDLITAGSVGLSEPTLDGDDVYWLESRAADSGRVVLVRLTPDGTRTDVTPAPYNVRSRVHEYGGGAYAVHDGTAVFTHLTDTRIYRLDRGSAEPVPITPEGPLRYGGLVLDPRRDHVVAVREDHTDPAAVLNTLVRLDLHGDNLDGGRVLVEGTDFVSPAALSDDGEVMAWVTWDHPNMPWDSTTAWYSATDADGQLIKPLRVVSAAGESLIAPKFSGQGLHLMSDRSGWWNLYWVRQLVAFRGHRPRGADSGELEATVETPRDLAGPPWVLGLSDYALTDNLTGLVRWYEAGIARLGLLDTQSRSHTPIDVGAVAINYLQARGDTAVFVAGYADAPTAVVRMRISTGETEMLRRAADLDLDPADVSVAQPVEWRSADGSPAYGFFYPPANARFTGPEDERPPLLVLSHGGPTSATDASLKLGVQYWTSRGYAVLDVNYGGSTGYGRAYRERLKGQWGVVDVDDCATGALAMADRGLVDRNRLAIRGGSAGGYTTLAALAFRDVFAAGASHFGVSDLAALARDTHKFESRYLDGLVGPWPEAEAVYRERSPLHHAKRIGCPLILLQGLEDRVVPPDQATLMADAVRANGQPVAVVMFEGEGHGFRRAETIAAALESEQYFYGRVLGFTPADALTPIPIDNL